MQNRIDELNSRLELLRRETSEVEYLIHGYRETLKQEEEARNKESNNKNNGTVEETVKETA